jgi:hypothetical protein
MKKSILLLTIFILSCGKSKADLEAAHDTHLEAMVIAKQLKTEMKTLQTNPETAVKADSLSILLHDWEAAVVEVPGFDHVHEEGHTHNHNGVDIRDEEQLKYQQQTLEAIKELQKSLK